MDRILTYATVCSGIECMSVACRGLPLRPVFFSEIEPFPCAVLKAHYPDVPNLGDMSKISVTNKTEITNGTVRLLLDARLDILAGGTPCQDVSVAGKRAGMQEGSGTRSSLAFEFVRLARELGPRYVIWENVAGAIDSKNAPDFLAFLRALGDCGYSLAWRVLDARYVRVDGMERAVPQRRRRVWVVGCSGADESRAAKILFEPDCVAGHTAPRRRTGQGFAYSLAGRDRVDAPVVGGAPGVDVLNFQGSKGNNCVTSDGSCPNLNAMHGHDVHVVALDGDKLKPREDQRKGGNGFGINEDGAGYTLTAVDRHGVAYGIDQQGGKGGANTTEGVAPTVLSDSHGTPHGVAYAADGGNVAATITRQISEQSGQDNRANAVVVSMAQNTRDEVRIIGGDGQIAGALPAEPGMKQQTYAVSTAFKLDSTASNSMKSKNPHSGFHEEQVAACLDTTTPDPSKNQGGNVIVSTNSNGEDVAPTISSCEYKMGQKQKDTGGGMSLAAVGIGHDAYNSGRNAKMGMSISSEVEPTMKAKSDGCGAVAQSNIAQMRYIVRRLTPTECERLMGLPDGYTIPAGLDANDPALVAEFQRIHDTFGAIMAEYEHAKPPKPKTAAQVQKWLAKITDPATCPDSPRYKGCGNGWATNQPRWILTRLLNAEGIEW